MCDTIWINASLNVDNRLWNLEKRQGHRTAQCDQLDSELKQ